MASSHHWIWDSLKSVGLLRAEGTFLTLEEFLTPLQGAAGMGEPFPGASALRPQPRAEIFGPFGPRRFASWPCLVLIPIPTSDRPQIVCQRVVGDHEADFLTDIAGIAEVQAAPDPGIFHLVSGFAEAVVLP